jgi:hypothetical protein
LDKGKVLEQGTHDELMAKEGGRYGEMVYAQQTTETDDSGDEETNKAQLYEEEEKERCTLLYYLQKYSMSHCMKATTDCAQSEILDFDENILIL